MKKLNLEQLEQIDGGSVASAAGCGISIAGIIVSGGTNILAWAGAIISCGATALD